MHRTARAVTFFSLALFLSPCVHADPGWQFAATGGARYVSMTEYDEQGRSLVNEQGWLPGLEGQMRYQSAVWQFDAGAGFYKGRIGYDGRLQTGSAYATSTATTQYRLQAGFARQLNATVSLLAAIEYDQWQRDILGDQTVLGLQERYRSWRMLAGAGSRAWSTPAARIGLSGWLVAASPEQLHVRFDRQAFDDADLSTRAALGTRLHLDMQPVAMPQLAFAAELDWLHVARSDGATLRSNGAAVGTVTQPAHTRRAVTLRAQYRF